MTTVGAGILKEPFDSEWASMAGNGNNGGTNVKDKKTGGAVSTNPFSGDGFEDEDEVDNDDQVHGRFHFGSHGEGREGIL
jgi:hypothetical protein